MDSLNKHFREITRSVFSAHGFAQADLACHWADIVGADLAEVSAPDCIKWPRRPGDDTRKSGGTLVIRAAAGRALDLQYETPRIIGRVNSFFGYAAVGQIKVTQGLRPPAKARRVALPQDVEPVCNQQLEGLETGPLKDALTRLGRAIGAQRPGSPQGK